MVDLLFQFVLFFLELSVWILKEVILRGVSGLWEEDTPSVSHCLIFKVVELVSETAVSVGGVSESRLDVVDDILLPLWEGEGDLTAVASFLALEEEKEEGDFGVGRFDVEL